MKLFTKEILARLPKLGATGHLTMDKLVVQAKLFNPMGAGTWYLMEYDPESKIAHAFVTLGDPQNAEMGDVSIQELEDLKLPMGMGIERDIHFTPRPLGEIYDIVKGGGHV
jgi:hypothetical protein